MKKVYRATANCPAGRIVPVDGQTYTLSGAWDQSDIGGGRSKWRDAAGKIVGRDNASGGLGISQQWEVLCPKASTVIKAPQRAAAVESKTSSALAGLPANSTRGPAVAEFAVGQVVMAKYGTNWVRARITGVRQGVGPKGPELSYDVRLDNGKLGIVPARMLRAQ